MDTADILAKLDTLLGDESLADYLERVRGEVDTLQTVIEPEVVEP